LSEDSLIEKNLEALKDPVRLQILFLLIKNGRTNVGDIAGQFKITRPAISHHLKVLKDANIAKSEKQGQEVFYSPNAHLVAQALRDLADKLEPPPSRDRKRKLRTVSDSSMP